MRALATMVSAVGYNGPAAAELVQKARRGGLRVRVGIAGRAEGLEGFGRAQPDHTGLAPRRNLDWTGDGARKQRAYVHV